MLTEVKKVFINADGKVLSDRAAARIYELMADCERANHEHSYEPHLSAFRIHLYASFDVGVYNPFGQVYNLAVLTGMQFDPGCSGGPAYLLIGDATEEQIDFVRMVLNDYGFVWCMAHKSFSFY